jgi:hypothetical protein
MATQVPVLVVWFPFLLEAIGVWILRVYLPSRFLYPFWKISGAYHRMTLPGDQDRITIIGATGSGKTHAAMWHLSLRNYDQKPWIIYDYKLEEFINEVPGTFQLGVTDPIPVRPGIYIVQPNIGDEDLVEAQMWKIWAQENVGVFIDEGYMLGNNNRGFRMLLTQGRSKHIPMIVLCQRPVWLDRFVFSEAQFFQVFHLNSAKDVQTVEQYVPQDLSTDLPERYSYYYDVRTRSLVVLRPMPDKNAILDTFDTKLRMLKKVI